MYKNSFRKYYNRWEQTNQTYYIGFGISINYKLHLVLNMFILFSFFCASFLGIDLLTGEFFDHNLLINCSPPVSVYKSCLFVFNHLV